MVCGQSKKSSSLCAESAINKDDDCGYLLETGMMQYFYHSPSSYLPVRDVLDEQKHGHKTEPHIEIGAENYCIDCYQRNIKSFVERHGKYLFLLTMCKNKNLIHHYGKQFIVGYIEKSEVINRGSFLCIKGQTKIVSFDDSINVKDFFGKNFAQSENRGKTLSLSRDIFLDCQKTKEILKQFENRTNILSECVEEIKKLDKENKTCLKCNFYDNGCLRWSIK